MLYIIYENNTICENTMTAHIKTPIRITEDALIEKYAQSKILMHLAKTPIVENCKKIIKSHPQLYAMGFNSGGRPDGLWLSRGSGWIAAAKELDNPKFPVCCYIYEVRINPHARILVINNQQEYEKFDKEFPNYWLNMDYFEVDFVDYLTDKTVRSPKKYKLILDHLRKKSGETMKEILINNNIIFTTPEAAVAGCEFYRTTDLPIERFRYKDWAAVAEKYQGIIFGYWDIDDAFMMSKLWFQSLDVASGCIWDATAIQEIELLYHKIDAATWAANS